MSEEQEDIKQQVSDFLKIRDGEGNILMHYVAKSGDHEFAKKLIAWGCDVNAKNNGGSTPLTLAISERNLEMVKILLNAGAQLVIDNLDPPRGPLQVAASCASPDIVQVLLDYGADVNSRDDIEGATALHYACRSFVDSIDRTINDRLRVMKILIDAGADINTMDRIGWTPLLYAIVCNFHAGVNMLVNKGAVIYHKKNGSFLLNIFLNCHDAKTFECLVKHGIDIHATDASGNSCLHAAVCLELVDVVEFLLSNGVRIDTVNNEGLDPLCFQLTNWYFFVFTDANDDHDKDIEEHKQYESYMKCFNTLIKHGTNVNHVTNDRMTPLYIVLDNYEHMHSNVVQILLKNGAQFDFNHPSVLKVINESNGSKFPHLLLRHTAMFQESRDRTDGPVNFNEQKLNEKLQQDFALCQAELASMKATKIGDTNVTFLKLLVDRDIGPFARNEHVVREFDQEYVLKKFPIYSDLVVERFSREVEFQKLVKQATDSLASVMNWDRNANIVPLDKILSYLNEKDMTNLVSIFNDKTSKN